MSKSPKKSKPVTTTTRRTVREREHQELEPVAHALVLASRILQPVADGDRLEPGVAEALVHLLGQASEAIERVLGEEVDLPTA